MGQKWRLTLYLDLNQGNKKPEVTSTFEKYERRNCQNRRIRIALVLVLNLVVVLNSCDRGIKKEITLKIDI